MVAVSLLALIMAVLFQIFNETTRAWAASERATDAYREARAGLFLMAQDLRSAVISEKTPLVVNSQTLLPSAAADSNSVFFLTAQATEGYDPSNRSDLCAVGYYVAYSNAADQTLGKPSYNLHRYFRSSNETFTQIKDFISNSNDITFLFKDIAPVQTGDEVLARNAFNLRIAYLDPAESDFDTEAAQFPVPLEPPLQLEISLDAINVDTAQKLDARSAWDAPSGASFDNLIKPNVQSFSVRVQLPRSVD